MASVEGLGNIFAGMELVSDAPATSATCNENNHAPKVRAGRII
jgi:hypothetical protein